MLTGRDERGQLTLLIIGFVGIAALLVLVAVDVSKVFLARRALSSAADAAALAATGGVDKSALYDGRGGCGGLLPLDNGVATQLAAESVQDDADDLRHTFAAVDAPATVVAGGTVSVQLDGDVALPFGRVLDLLLPGHPGGHVHVTVVSHAQSPLTATGGC